jgi:hypothetical protein
LQRVAPRFNLRGMQRRFLTCLLSVLLLLMQHEALRHALDHIGAQLQRIEHSVLERPTGSTCTECELIAAGAGSIPATSPASVAVAPVWVPVTTPVEAFAAVAPSYYQSRAPPLPFQHA